MPKRFSTVRGREFGEGLRSAIRQAGLVSRTAAHTLVWDEAKLSDLVNGKGGSTETDLALLLGLCRTEVGERRHLQSLFPSTNVRGWWQQHGKRAPVRNRTFVEQVAQAKKLTSWHTHMIPDVLQTPAYLRGVLRASSTVPEDELEARVAAHLETQQQLLRRNLLCTFFLHEFALRLRVDNVETQVAQGRYLLKMAARSNIAIRILPADRGAHAGLRGPFTQLSFPGFEPLVWLEGENSSLILEDKEAVEGYQEVVSSLSLASLDAEESKAVINDVLRAIEKRE